MDLTRGCRRWFYLLAIVVLVAVPSLVMAQQDAVDAQLLPDAYTRDAEVVLINRNDGHIVIRDYAVGPNMVDLSGKYDHWGGPYFAVTTGDFNGDGTREVVASGGYSVDAPGPILNIFDPAAPMAGSLVPTHTVAIPGYQWILMGTGDVDGDGRDELVAIRTTQEPGNIFARINCYEFEGGAWREKWSLPTGGAFRDMTIGDFNGDGRADVVLARNFRYVVALDGNNPTIEYFNAQVGGPTGVGEWNRIRMGDVTGDGVRDLVLMRSVQAVKGNFPAAVLIITPTGLNTYTDGYGWGFGDPPEDIQLFDVNLDGKLEIAAMNTGEFARIYILNPRMNDPANNNTEFENWIGDREWGPNLVVADVNGDYRTEMLLIHTTEKVDLPDYFLRILGFHDGAGYADDAFGFPYSYQFTAANLDGAGIQRGAIMDVANEVILVYDETTATAGSASVAVRNLGSGSFNWNASVVGSSPWLQITPTSGAAGSAFTLTVNTASLPANGTTATVRVVGTPTSGTTVVDGTQDVTVTLRRFPRSEKQYLPFVATAH